MPGAPAQVDAGDGNVSPPEQQFIYALAQPTEKAPTQNHHRFFQRPQRRTSSLCHPLPTRPPTYLPNRFVNWPWAGFNREQVYIDGRGQGI